MISNYRFRWWHFLGVIALIVLVQGIKTVDTDMPVYWSQLSNHARLTLPSAQGFLLEGLLFDAIGVCLVHLQIHKITPNELGWAVGVIILVGAFVYSVIDGTISLVTAFLAVSLTRIVDSLSQWVGKLDPFLFAFLILTANRNRWVATGAAGLAAFCHPLAAIVSTIGVNLVAYYNDRKLNLPQLILTVVCAGVDLVAFRSWFPSGSSRAEFVTTQIRSIAENGLQFGVFGAIIGIALPVISVGYMTSNKPKEIGVRGLLVLFWLAGIFFISSMMTLDHTRVGTLLLLAPFLIWLDERLKSNEAPLLTPALFGVIFISRLFVPHVNEGGAQIFQYDAILRLVPGAMH